ncbi:uncharacterized protein EV420DRAFT_1652037 [Desarmillaria tabescens]|uniref:Uncharacterized protein n=1 Tax=Armillaria tabescens TaxID=1929756 RepID=A0AA39J9S6_ARMTA|nr:uncharacterized protein EV420DRAFT_1652037 [Desarmillaria tabescens]KAK0437424.1 hypothetical protein EV420DRAFT_1652037 [Desarmillaria tabescens]
MTGVQNPDALWDRTSLTHTLHVPVWLSPQAQMYLINVVSTRFPSLLEDNDGDQSPSTLLPAIPTHTRLLSAPTMPSRRTLFPMPPLSVLPLTPTLQPFDSCERTCTRSSSSHCVSYPRALRLSE